MRLRSFTALLAFLVIGLLAPGFYLLGSAFVHPLEADSASLVAAALLLSLGFVILSYLLRSMLSTEPLRGVPRARSLPQSAAGELPQNAGREGEPVPLPSHRIYVDRARVSR